MRSWNDLSRSSYSALCVGVDRFEPRAMLAAMSFAFSGSSQTCGLPKGCTSPHSRESWAGQLEGRDAALGDDATGLPRLDLGVPGALDHLGGPHLELEPELDEKIRLARALHQRRAGLDVVRILARIGQALDRDTVAADLPREGREHGQRRDDAHGSRRCRSGPRIRGGEGEDESEEGGIHGADLSEIDPVRLRRVAADDEIQLEARGVQPVVLARSLSECS
jgi:hypothetical protein